jgi:NAD(P)-dependent dehydrogenase (short-subunit alcohol dehydrogenase family)
MTRESTIHELFDLTGRVALVTGATGHLGRSMAAALAEAGATVVAASRDERRANELAKMLPSPQRQRHLGVALDQMKCEEAASAFDRAADSTGGVDILVNAAHDPLADDWTTVSAEQFNNQLAHATAYFLLARKLRDHAVARGKPASIVMLGSMYGVVGSYPDSYAGVGPANPVAYQTLKGGILQMTRHLAVYWAKDRVRVNCLSPGPFPRDTMPAELRDRLASKSPTGRLGAPQELKGAVILLASDAGSYITGQNVIVDGGWTAW